MSKCVKCGAAFENAGDKSGQCKSCKSAYNRWHYLNNRATYVARPAVAKNRVKAKHRALLRENLLDHPCVDCGEKDPLVLEFDHIGMKTQNVADLLKNGHSWKRILVEIAECEVRCANCHRRATAQRAGWSRLMLPDEQSA